MPKLRQRWRFFFDKGYWSAVGVIGVLLEAVSIVTWNGWQPWSAVFGGIGASMLATVVVSFWGPGGDPVYQTFVRLGVTEFYPDRDRFAKDKWIGLLRQARQRCVLLGLAHGGWCLDPSFEPVLRERVRAGVKVEVFFLDPNGEAATVRHNEDQQRLEPLKPRIKRSIRAMWAVRERLEAAVKDGFQLYVYNATPSVGLTWIDDAMLVTHYLAGQINLTSPLLRIEFRPTPDTLFAVYAANVDALRRSFSTLITPENIAYYTPEETDG